MAYGERSKRLDENKFLANYSHHKLSNNNSVLNIVYNSPLVAHRERNNTNEVAVTDEIHSVDRHLLMPTNLHKRKDKIKRNKTEATLVHKIVKERNYL